MTIEWSSVGFCPFLFLLSTCHCCLLFAGSLIRWLPISSTHNRAAGVACHLSLVACLLSLVVCRLSLATVALALVSTDKFVVCVVVDLSAREFPFAAASTDY